MLKHCNQCRLPFYLIEKTISSGAKFCKNHGSLVADLLHACCGPSDSLRLVANTLAWCWQISNDVSKRVTGVSLIPNMTFQHFPRGLDLLKECFNPMRLLKFSAVGGSQEIRRHDMCGSTNSMSAMSVRCYVWLCCGFQFPSTGHGGGCCDYSFNLCGDRCRIA